MPVLDRSELEASPLADLHAIADQLGLDGFRRLRKADLIDAILGEPGRPAPEPEPTREGSSDGEDEDSDAADGGERAESGSRPRRRRSPRSRRSGVAPKEDLDAAPEDEEDTPTPGEGGGRRGRGRGGRGGSSGERAPRSGERSEAEEEGADSRIAEGIVELLGNGSAFLRVSPPDPSDEDVYISAAQVRRCELISGDRVAGPVRLPRRSERYPSLVRIDTINGASADEVSEGARYEDLPVEYPRERRSSGSPPWAAARVP
jgi:transcription termination factor Rho